MLTLFGEIFFGFLFRFFIVVFDAFFNSVTPFTSNSFACAAYFYLHFFSIIKKSTLKAWILAHAKINACLAHVFMTFSAWAQIQAFRVSINENASNYNYLIWPFYLKEICGKKIYSWNLKFCKMKWM